MGKSLYLECYSGISGDMTVAALLDLGAREEALRKALDALHVDGYQIRIGRTKKCGIDACDFDVVLEEENGHGTEGHSHEPEGYMHGEEKPGHDVEQHTHGTEGYSYETEGYTHGEEEHPHAHSHEMMAGAGAAHVYSAKRMQEHVHEAEHSHTHSHTHSHEHRHYADIMNMLDRAPLKAEVRSLAKKIFQIVAEAEARVHSCPVEEVHFHETGAVDSIVDIVGAAACVVDLGITDTYVSALYEGQGHVWCQHGRIPVPAPAVAGIAAAEGLELRITSTQGEMVTPTGAAIAAALRTRKGTPGPFQILKIGMGAGKKDFPHANLLRAILIEEETTPKQAMQPNALKDDEDEIWVLETNLDDTTGEALGFAMEELFAAGARDVSYTPIYMKKNRPAYRLEVLCKEEDVPRLETLIFRHTTGIGLRKRKETRRILPRKTQVIPTPFGEATVKLCLREGEAVIYPEYESVRTLARATGKSYQEIYQRVVEEAWKRRGEF